MSVPSYKPAEYGDWNASLNLCSTEHKAGSELGKSYTGKNTMASKVMGSIKGPRFYGSQIPVDLALPMNVQNTGETH